MLACAMSPRSKLLWLTIWSLAFGLLEGAVVTYLRRIVGAGAPLDGPLFPLRIASRAVLLTEIAREAATLVMLAGVAALAERGAGRRFAAFAFAFGIWDLAYYAMLELAIGWPKRLLEWDVLFLIPAPWASPVLAPVLVSLALVVCSATLLLGAPPERPAGFGVRNWLAIGAGGVAILVTFFWNTPRIARLERPAGYPWWLFLAGWLGGLASFARARMRASRAAPR